MSVLMAFLRGQVSCAECGRRGRRRRCVDTNLCGRRRELNELIASMPSAEEERRQRQQQRDARIAEIMRDLGVCESGRED